MTPTPIGAACRSWYARLGWVVLCAVALSACGQHWVDVSVADTSPPMLSASSVVRISGEACGRLSVGGGVAVEADRIITSAHVVAGVNEVAVVVAGVDEPVSGTVVGFDPNRDLAMVELAEAVLRPVSFDAQLGDVEQLAVHMVVVPDEGPTELREITIGRVIVATGDDIYRRAGARRRALELVGSVEAGESGSGLFLSNGSLVGIVFANSSGTTPRSYAVEGSEIDAFIAELDGVSQSTGPCLSQPPPAPDEPGD